MKITLDIPDYDGDGLDVIWENGAKYAINIAYNSVVISADKAALVSIAKQMLYMAYNDLPGGSHVHYDSFFTKINGEYELVIEKKEHIPIK